MTARSYATSVVTFLALALDRCADFCTAFAVGVLATKSDALVWQAGHPDVLDFAEANLLGGSVGGWTTCSEYVADCIETLQVGPAHCGTARQIDAASGSDGIRNLVVSTDAALLRQHELRGAQRLFLCLASPHCRPFASRTLQHHRRAQNAGTDR